MSKTILNITLIEVAIFIANCSKASLIAVQPIANIFKTVRSFIVAKAILSARFKWSCERIAICIFPLEQFLSNEMNIFANIDIRLKLLEAPHHIE